MHQNSRMPSTIPHVSEHQRFIERMGLAWEQEGLPRIAGRIFGFLLLQDDACSLDDMASALEVSKASISTDARRLEQLNLIVRVSRPGDRRDYYAMAPDVPVRALELKIASMRRMTIAPAERDRIAASVSPAVQARLLAFGAAHEHMIAALERLVAELRPLLPARPPVPPAP